MYTKCRKKHILYLVRFDVLQMFLRKIESGTRSKPDDDATAIRGLEPREETCPCFLIRKDGTLSLCC